MRCKLPLLQPVVYAGGSFLNRYLKLDLYFSNIINVRLLRFLFTFLKFSYPTSSNNENVLVDLNSSRSDVVLNKQGQILNLEL